MIGPDDSIDEDRFGFFGRLRDEMLEFRPGGKFRVALALKSLTSATFLRPNEIPFLARGKQGLAF